MRKHDKNILFGTTGLSLIELLIALVFLVAIAITVAIFFPKASRAQFFDRQRLIATQLASAKIDNILKQPYGYVDVTPTGTSIWGTTNIKCDCSDATLDFTQMPLLSATNPNGSDNIHKDSITFYRWVCINQVQRLNNASIWTTSCLMTSPSNDTGFKAIHVQVRWNAGNGTNSAVNVQNIMSES